MVANLFLTCSIANRKFLLNSKALRPPATVFMLWFNCIRSLFRRFRTAWFLEIWKLLSFIISTCFISPFPRFLLILFQYFKVIFNLLYGFTIVISWSKKEIENFMNCPSFYSSRLFIRFYICRSSHVVQNLVEMLFMCFHCLYKTHDFLFRSFEYISQNSLFIRVPTNKNRHLSLSKFSDFQQ